MDVISSMYTLYNIQFTIYVQYKICSFWNVGSHGLEAERQRFSLKSAGICFIRAARKLIWDAKGCTHFPFPQTNQLQRRHRHNQTKVLLEGHLLHANTTEQKSCNRKSSKPKCTGCPWLCVKGTGELTQPWGAPPLIVLYSEKGCYLPWHTEFCWRRLDHCLTPHSLQDRWNSL